MRPPSASPWLRLPRRDPSPRVRLLCLPYAGSGVLTYHGWSRALPDGIEVCPLQLPGRDNRIQEQPFTAAEPLVEAAGSALAAELTVPVALFGHSMGAILAFELAHWFRRELGVEPVRLFVSAADPPERRLLRERIHDLPEPDFLARLGELGGTPHAILAQPELRELLLPALRADFALCDAYRYRERQPLACPITVFGGTADPLVDPTQLGGWARQTHGRCDVVILPGGHFFLAAEARADLLRTIGAELESDASPAVGPVGRATGNRW